MSDDELSPEAANLIATVRAERTLTADQRERSYGRIGVGIGVAASGVFAARTAAAAGTSASTAPAAATTTAVVAVKWWVIAGLLAVASAAGVGAYVATRSPVPDPDSPDARSVQARPAPVQQPAVHEPAPAEPSPKAAAADSPPTADAIENVAPQPVSLAPSSRKAARPAADTLAEEVGLLHQARAALHADSASALALATRHEHRYPRSQLAAEREVVMILALCDLGRATEARRRAASLSSRSPALAALKGSCAERR